ncbi:MAG: hypothetical protein V1742_03640, partial [Pseudomonadota bacterium]
MHRFMTKFKKLILALVFTLSIVSLLAACGGGGGGGAVVAPPPAPPAEDTPDFAIFVDPTIPVNGTTNNTNLAIAGTVADLKTAWFPAAVAFTAVAADQKAKDVTQDSSGTFAISATGAWSGAITLSPGDNVITLSIPNTTISYSFKITCNPGYTFPGQLVLTPDVAYVDEGRQITATIALTDATTDTTDVQLVLVTAGGETVVVPLQD